MKIPAAILVRVSTSKQETARQLAELMQYAVGKGYSVVEVCKPTRSATVQRSLPCQSCFRLLSP